MSKAKNQRFAFKSTKELFAFKEEVEKYLGRYCPSYDLDKLTLVVSPLPEKYKRKADAERKLRAKREAAEYDDYDYEAEAQRYERNRNS